MSQHIRIARLESRKWACTVTVDGVAQDLTGCGLAFTVKTKLTDTDGQAVFQLTKGNGITVTNTSGGLYNLVISSTNSASVAKSTKQQQFFYDHRIQLTDGAIKVLESGDFIITPNATDSTTFSST